METLESAPVLTSNSQISSLRFTRNKVQILATTLPAQCRPGAQGVGGPGWQWLPGRGRTAATAAAGPGRRGPGRPSRGPLTAALRASGPSRPTQGPVPGPLPGEYTE